MARPLSHIRREIGDVDSLIQELGSVDTLKNLLGVSEYMVTTELRRFWGGKLPSGWYGPIERALRERNATLDLDLVIWKGELAMGPKAVARREANRKRAEVARGQRAKA